MSFSQSSTSIHIIIRPLTSKQPLADTHSHIGGENNFFNNIHRF